MVKTISLRINTPLPLSLWANRSNDINYAMSVFQSLKNCPSFLYLARLSFSVELSVTSLPPYCHELLISGRDVSVVHGLFPTFSERGVLGKTSSKSPAPSSSASSGSPAEPITWYESLNQLRSSAPSSPDLSPPPSPSSAHSSSMPSAVDSPVARIALPSPLLTDAPKAVPIGDPVAVPAAPLAIPPQICIPQPRLPRSSFNIELDFPPEIDLHPSVEPMYREAVRIGALMGHPPSFVRDHILINRQELYRQALI